MLGVAATAGGSKLAAPGKLKFNQTMGSILPTRAGKTIVSVLCDGPPKSLCRGNVRLVPRGATRQELGAAPIAGRSFRLGEGDDGNLQLELSGRTRNALADRSLAVTIQLRIVGKGLTTRAATVAASWKN